MSTIYPVTGILDLEEKYRLIRPYYTVFVNTTYIRGLFKDVPGKKTIYCYGLYVYNGGN